MRSERARPLALALALVIGATVALALRFGSDAPEAFGRLVERLQTPRAATPVETMTTAEPRRVTPDPLRDHPPIARELLTAPFPEWPTRFSKDGTLDPKALCRWLRSQDVGRTTFSEEGTESGAWICNSDLRTFGDLGPLEASSLFASLRGSEQNRIEYLRVKLNLIDEQTAEEVRARGADLFREIHAELRWPLPKTVDLAIREGQEVKLEYKQMIYEVLRELTDPRRINVVVTARPDTGILEAGRFTRDLSILPIALLPTRPGRPAVIGDQ